MWGHLRDDAARKTLIARGTFPPVMRNGSAEVALALDRPEAYAVWALASSGRRLERMPATVRGGRLAFTATVKGPRGARMCYEVVRAGGDVLDQVLQMSCQNEHVFCFRSGTWAS